MKYFLVKEVSNYADEFDLEGFEIHKAENLEEVESQILLDVGDNFPKEIYFGTNEFQEYQNKEEMFRDLNIQEITQNEYEVLEKLFDGSFGTTAIL